MPRPGIVVVGTSWGGLAALGTLLSRLPSHFPVPIAIVQHRGAAIDDTMARVLQGRCRLTVRDAEDKDPIEPGRVYLAPPDYHLLIDDGFFALSVDEPVAFSRPSIDVLFESAADAYGARVIGVVLTGANEDGSRGLAKIKRGGGTAIVQDPSTAESGTMPARAMQAVKPDFVLSLDRIGDALVRLTETPSTTFAVPRAEGGT